MSSFGLKLFIVWSIVHVTFGQNPLEEIISSAVQRVLEGVETRLLKQTQLLESRLSEQTRLFETRLAENTRATNERMTGLEEIVVNEGKTSASTTEARLRENLVHTTLTVTTLLQGMEQRMKNNTKSHFHDIMRHGNSIAHRLEERVTEESKIGANITESLLADNLANTNRTVRALLRHLGEHMKSEVKSSGHRIEHHTKAAVQGLEQNVTREMKSLRHKIEHHTKAAVHGLEGRLVNNTQFVVRDLEGRLTASCFGDIEQLLSAVQNTASQAAGCCVETTTQRSRTVKPTTVPTPTVKPTTNHTATGKPPTTRTPTERPTTTTTPTERPASTHTPTERPTTTPTPTERPTTTPTLTGKPMTTPTPTDTTTTSPTKAPREVVFLRRKDGSVEFNRDWEAYKSGFGNQTGEFWLGLDNLHNLTTRHNYSLRVDLTDWSGETKWEEWSTFRVAGEGDEYQLTVSGPNRASTAGENLGHNSGRRFSTRDRGSNICVVRHQGAWWYGYCSNANPTGPYKPAGYRGDKGIYWYNANTPFDMRSFKGVTMKLVKL